MSTLYIDRRNSRIGVIRNTLELYEEEKLRQRIPFSLIRRIVVIGNIQVQTGALGTLSAAGISVTLLSGRQYRHRGVVLGPLGNDGARRLAQYRACTSRNATRAIARCLLQRKIAAQLRLLRKALSRRPDKRRVVRKGIEELSRIATRLRAENLTLATYRGLEGAAAAAYFNSYGALIPSDLGFTGRKRRPPPDPVNAVLSLGYSLLYGEAVNAIHAVGLDPALGYLHEPAWGRESLAADLVEPLRARHDELVWRLFAERTLKMSHFDRHDGGFWLNKKGRALFFRKYEEIAAPARRWLRLFLQALIEKLQKESGDEWADIT